MLLTKYKEDDQWLSGRKHSGDSPCSLETSNLTKLVSAGCYRSSSLRKWGPLSAQQQSSVLWLQRRQVKPAPEYKKESHLKEAPPSGGDLKDYTTVVSDSSVAQSCPTLCDPMDSSRPGFPVQHQLPELSQTHVHWVGDVIQPCHLLSSLSPPAFNLSQHQGLF